MIRRKKLWPLLVGGAAYALWGLNAPMIKTGLESLPIGIILVLKFALGGIVFTLLAKRQWKKVAVKSKVKIVVATILGYVITNYLFYEGVRLSGGLNASLVYLLSPILLYFFSIEFLKEKFDSRLLFGLLVGFVGSILIVCAPLLNGVHSSTNFVGNILVITAIIADIWGTILIKPLLGKVSPMQMTALRFNVAFIALLPIGIIEASKIDTINLPPDVLIALGYNLVFATILGYYFYHWSLSKVKAEEMSPLHYLDPMFGALGSILLLGEKLTLIMMSGVLLVVLGLYYAEINRKISLHLGHHR